MKETGTNSDKTEMMDDTLTRAASGDANAFCELYFAYKEKLYRYALYKLGSPEDAEDAVSECVMAAWNGIRGLKSKEAFVSWIFSILSNCCNKHIKTEIRARERMQDLYDSELTGGQSTSGLTAQSIELAEALDILKDDEREIVLMSVVGGLTSNEIASITKLTSGSVRSKLSRSLSKMRDFLS